MEWSICCAYDEILELALSDPSLPSFELPETDNWLKDSVHAAALLSNRYYDALIDAYDMTEACVQPKVALDLSSRRMLAQLFTWAISGWASILDRLAFESPAKVPSFSLTWPTLLAAVKVPVARITKTISDAQQKREVEAILQEYLSTGGVKRSLPEEQVTVAKARIRYPELLPTQREISDARSIVTELDARQSKGVGTTPIIKPTNIVTTKQCEESQSVARDTRVETISVPSQPIPQTTNAAKRFKRLELDSPIVEAPAIGPKTAARLQAVGVTTVRQLLASDSEQLAQLLKASWINPQKIDQWKGQSRLAIEIAGLSSAGSGLLFLSGVTTSEELLSRSVDELHQMVVQAARTAQGQRVLRDKPPPSRDLINQWRQRAIM
jgi:predicted flap endonuclease-1-like 5' DNA nuclease